MTTEELDQHSRTQMKGDTQAALRFLLQEADAANDWFYGKIFAEFPDLQSASKSAGIADGCCHTKAVSDYAPSQVDAIIARFRSKFGDANTARMLDIAEQAVQRLISSPTPSPALPFGEGYARTMNAAYGWSFRKMSAIKTPAALRGQVVMPSFPLVVNYGGEFEREVWRNGYKLVSAKFTKNLLPEAMQAISQGLTEKLSWQEISAVLNGRYAASRGHWVRLVRSEMGQAAHRASVRQYETVPQLKAKWSTSRMGETCPICLGLDGNIYAPKDVPPLPHPNCRCVVVPTF